ncbi:hypothetical protein [Halorussus sp. MSC15.2]|uniref:hypothetical protein n=1 Tax=Halorussus sp. MSC15.2 TaxID=2283638 RepID=UPI0013CF83A2|nr:hypothetical protein [Halorussus sp. MSC15.2]NEU58591.1 hypothetical protein [Halorussus sp. MSC15.2]
MNVETLSTIPCPACDGVAHATEADQWGMIEGWRCRTCQGRIANDGGRRTFDVTTLTPGTEFCLESLSEQVETVTGIESPRVVSVGESDGRYRVVPGGGR